MRNNRGNNHQKANYICFSTHRTKTLIIYLRKRELFANSIGCKLLHADARVTSVREILVLRKVLLMH